MNVGTISHLAGFIAYLVLNILLFFSWRGSLRGLWLIVCSLLTCLWSALLAFEAEGGIISPRLLWTAELGHAFTWPTFLALLIGTRPHESAHGAGSRSLRFVWALSFAFAIQLILIWSAPYFELRFPGVFDPVNIWLGFIAFALIGLVLVEQYFRGTRADFRWHVKFLCIALGAEFAYDFYLYSDAVLFHRVNENIWAARGAVSALAAPLLAVSAARNPDWTLDVFVSRQVVFRSAILLGAGVYLLFMASAGYYIRIFGGQWGTVAQIIFLVGGFIALAILLFSGQARAHARVFFSKNFFQYAYDYREEWLRIINTLSKTRSDLALEQRIVMALGEAVESPSGVLWIREANGPFVQRASYGDPQIDVPCIDARDPVIRFMEEKEWIVNLDELIVSPGIYHELEYPAWLESFTNAWLLVPLSRGEGALFGVVLLTTPRAQITWNWEVVDLIKTSSRLAVSYLALEDAGRALAEARQFEGFNRLSAFVMHDLKNLIAQLSLVVRNAERHRDNPAFMSDAMLTVDNAVAKMSRLLSQLKNFGAGQSMTDIELPDLVGEVVSARRSQLPAPQFEDSGGKIMVRANADRLASAIEHVIHNAQDAAGRQGKVVVRVRSTRDEHAVIEVLDDGEGMTDDFVQTRLFRPFDTTKGLTGMGIGAYESREYIRALGGELLVTSEPGKGSLFTFVIPTNRAMQASPVAEEAGPV